MNELTKIGKIHGTDKAGPQHNYTEKVYFHLLKNIRDKPLRILELGAGDTGASIKMWRDFLPNADVTLFDPFFITHSSVTVTVEEIKNLGVNVIVGNQLNRGDLQRLSPVNPADSEEEYYDIIIDDAAHVSDGIAISLANLLPKLKKNGCYIVEDLSCAKDRDNRLHDMNAWLDGEDVNQNIEKIYHKREVHLIDAYRQFQQTGKWVTNNVLTPSEVDYLENNIKNMTIFADYNGAKNLAVIKKM